MTLNSSNSQSNNVSPISSFLRQIGVGRRQVASVFQGRRRSTKRGIRTASCEVLEDRRLLAADVAVLSAMTQGDEAGPVDIVYTVSLSAPNDTGAAVTFDLDDLHTGTATSGVDSGWVFAEVADAPNGIAGLVSGQHTVGGGPLTGITGSLGNGDGSWATDGDNDHVDAFRITVTDVSAFFVSTVAADGGSYVGDNGSINDSTLYLFDVTGEIVNSVVMANDDKPGVFGRSYLSDPSTFSGNLTNSPGSVTAGKDYVLAITYSTNNALDILGNKVVDFSTGSAFKDLHGVAPGSATNFPNNWGEIGDFGNNTMNYTIALGGATFSTAADYTAIPSNAQISVAAGASTGSFTVGVIDDLLQESTETVIAQISNPSSTEFEIGTATATATITDNDAPTANLSVTTQGDENGAVGIVYSVTLSKTNDTGAAITFDLNDLLTGSAASGSDYTAIPANAQISVATGGSTGSFTVDVTDDTSMEGTETVTSQISNASSNEFLIGTASATANITDNDSAMADLSVTVQGDETGPVDIVYTVTLSKTNETGTAITFDLDDLLAGTAKSGLDYTVIPTNAQISVAAGASTGTLNVAVTDDALLEATETVITQISTPSHAAVTIGMASVTAAITDNDTATANLSVTTQGDETALGDVVYTVTLSETNDTGAAITFDLDDLLTGTATSGTDYTAIPANAQISVAAGANTGTLTVAVTDDVFLEDTESVVAQISSSSSGSVTIGTASATADITDNDTATADLSVTTQGDETGPADIVYTVTLSKTNDTGAVITFHLADLLTGSATSGSDYAAIPMNSQLSVAAGASTGSVAVAVTDDAELEAAETVIAQISNPSNGAITIGLASATASISDNDDANTAPEIISLTAPDFDNKGASGDSITLSGSFSDPDLLDTHTVTVDWGNGDVETLTAGQVDQNADTFSANYVYDDGGIYTITVTVSDGVNQDIQSTTAVITGMRLMADGELQIIGTDNGDVIRVFKSGESIIVAARLVGSSTQYLSIREDEVSSLLIFACDGNDRVSISDLIDKPATIKAGAGQDFVIGGGGDDTLDGGLGNDVMLGGGGNDIILGGRGNDWIFGGLGRDILIGGAGNDWIFDFFGDNIVIGGTTDHDADNAALSSIRDEWSSSNSFNTRVANIRNGGGLNGTNVLDANTVHADSKQDHLFAPLGQSWMWAESIDQVMEGFNGLVDIDDN